MLSKIDNQFIYEVPIKSSWKPKIYTNNQVISYVEQRKIVVEVDSDFNLLWVILEQQLNLLNNQPMKEEIKRLSQVIQEMTEGQGKIFCMATIEIQQIINNAKKNIELFITKLENQKLNHYIKEQQLKWKKNKIIQFINVEQDESNYVVCNQQNQIHSRSAY